MENDNKNIDLVKVILDRNRAEYAVSYDIPHRLRLSARDAWIHARTIGKPFNCLLTFEFKRNKDNPKSDVEHIRRVAHYARVYLARLNIDVHMIWSRFVAVESDIEQCAMLLHVPDWKYEIFSLQVQSWKFEEIGIEQVTYEPDRLVNGQRHTVLEWLLKATDNETKYKVPNTLSEQSSMMIGVRVFHSWKLKKSRLIEHGRQARLAKLVIDQ